MFQNVVIVTHKQGVKHLWIDSLCIIQVSLEDRQIESSKMAEIFLGAHFTISAMFPENCMIQFPNCQTKGFSNTITIQFGECSGTPNYLKGSA
jgi:hypothetical protein